MKAEITSTERLVEMKDGDGRRATTRVWEGISENGVKFTAYVMMVQVATDADNTIFERELRQHVEPRADIKRAIDMRFVL